MAANETYGILRHLHLNVVKLVNPFDPTRVAGSVMTPVCYPTPEEESRFAVARLPC